MKILLDECVTKKLKPHLSTHEVHTVTEMGWSGIKNGKLLRLCVDNNFDILLTIDKNIMFQQHIADFNIIIVILNSGTSKVEELVRFVPSFENQLNLLKKRTSYLIEK